MKIIIKPRRFYKGKPPKREVSVVPPNTIYSNTVESVAIRIENGTGKSLSIQI